MKRKESRPATSVSAGSRRPRFAGIHHRPGQIGMDFVIAKGCSHLRQKDLGSIVRPSEGRSEQTQHEAFHTIVKSELVPSA